MPLPLVPIIAAGSALAQSGINAASARAQQKRANEFNLDMWNRQNAYNTPAEQMKRFKDAGLNPNLIYGQGNSGNAGSAPQFERLAESGLSPINVSDATSVFSQMYDLRTKNAQVDRLQAETENTKQETLLKILDGVGKTLQNKKLQAEAPYFESIAKMSAEALDASIQKTKAATTFTLDENQRQAIQNSRNVAESIARVYQIETGTELTKQMIKNAGLEQVIKQLDAKLAGESVRPSDPLWYRHVMPVIELIMERLKPKEEETSSGLSQSVKKFLGW